MIGLGTDSAHAGRLLRRAAVLWLPLRTLMFIAAVAFRLDPRLVPVGNVLVVIVAATLCAVDARAMRETVFHANLGTPPWAPALAGALFAIAIELVVAATVAVLPLHAR